MAGLAGCLSEDGPGGGGSDSLRIGVMQPLTGDLEYYGQQSLWGFLSGLAYKHDADPLDIDSAGEETVEGDEYDYELLIEDTEFDADQAQSVATDLVQNRDVDVLFGTASSGSARQVIGSVVANTDTPFIAGPAAAADITSSSEYCHDRVFRANENTAMDARSGGQYVANQTDVQRVYIMAADYSFGRAVARNYRTVLESEGIEIVGEQFVPRGYSEFQGLYDNAVEANADAVIGGFTVSTLPAFLSTGLAGDYDLRMFGGFATMISNRAIGGVAQRTFGEDFTAQDLRDAELGPFTTRYHWNQYDNEINNTFVEDYTNTYGTVPDLFTSGTFTAASSLVQAVEESGSTSADDVVDALTGMTVQDTPKGEGGYTYQEYNNQARSSMTIANPVPTSDEWASNWDAAVMPSEPIATVGGEESTLSQDAGGMDCNLSG
ncbi:amino acid/amide ABC transporter substrate-binding protein, HAAT family [Natronoarchaeum philippinense]|uniref:Amino acid/amide ABC transporter substrate-binding protein, HAAT family n=2 Tax=Natronoarchaeum philippinense TaxID=558529 RepID=A0A285ND22_NATPI|nr:amino acid/amide ABC transporter substrate-binding protein, HAAT family [Natronoarchaeum philippinense]